MMNSLILSLTLLLGVHCCDLPMLAPGVHFIGSSAKTDLAVNTKEPVLLILFSASWCPSCPAEKAKVSTLRAEQRPVMLADFDDPKYASYLKKFRISSVPTWLMAVDGEGWQKHRGAMTTPQLRGWLKQAWTRSKADEPLRLPKQAPSPMYQASPPVVRSAPMMRSGPSYGCGNLRCAMCYGGGGGMRW